MVNPSTEDLRTQKLENGGREVNTNK